MTARKKMAKTPPKPKRTQAEPKRPESASREANLIPMGRLGAARGLSGWLRVFSYSDPPEQLQNYRQWTLDINGRQEQVTLRRLRAAGNGLVCHIADVDSREAAEALNGAEIHVPRDALPPAAEDEWYWADLEGLKVRNLDGEDLGDVSGLMATGANDVLIVQGDRKRLIPFGSRVREVNLSERSLVVDWDAAD